MGRNFKRPLKVALVHDVILGLGGAEKVLLELSEMYPEAPIYTFYINKKDQYIKKHFSKKEIYSSLIQHLPYLQKMGRYFSLFKLFSWLYFHLLNLSQYNIVISSSHSFNSKGITTKGKTLHICYLYTPPKYLYEECNELSFIKQSGWRQLFYPILYLLRRIDLNSSKRPDHLVAISDTVRSRIRKYYHRDSAVLYPPVRLLKPISQSKKDHYLFMSRLVSQKGLDFIIDCFKKNHLPLMVVGDGPLRNKYRENLPTNIKFVGRLIGKPFHDLLAHTIALIYNSIDEDFGLVPVELMSAGIPVIAYNSGAIHETVIDGKTGYLYQKQNYRNLSNAIQKLHTHPIDPANCIEQSRKFSSIKFRKQFSNLVTKCYQRKIK